MKNTISRNRVNRSDKGRLTFFIDNRIVSRKKYEEIMGPYTPPAKEKPQKSVEECPFCGSNTNEPVSRRKVINGLLVKMCNPHWESKTTGELAEALKST